MYGIKTKLLLPPYIQLNEISALNSEWSRDTISKQEIWWLRLSIVRNIDFCVLFNPTLHGGAIIAPPINLEASQLQQEGLVWFTLHIN